MELSRTVLSMKKLLLSYMKLGSKREVSRSRSNVMALCSKIDTRLMSTTSNNPSSGVAIFSGREQESYHRGRKNDSQRCDIIDTQRTSKQGVPIPNLLCSKEGWGVETHNEHEKAEHLCGDSPLQNGRHLHAKGYPQPRRLDDKN